MEIIDRLKAVIGDKYDVEEQISKGGMGAIYLGVHKALNKKVAIKIIHQELSKNEKARKRFYREAKLSASLDHQGIINIFDFGSEEDFDYIIMQFINGPTLKDWLRRHKDAELSERIRIIIEMARALSYAHEKGVIHRDIKPTNIMLDAQGNVVITDFGISKNLTDDEELTVASTVFGSPKYMSPEQITQSDAVDARSDLYSLGLIVYEMLAGKHPYEGKDASSLYYSHVHEQPVRPDQLSSEVPAPVADIIMKLLAKSPNDRYPDGKTLIRDLEGYLQGTFTSQAGAPQLAVDDDDETVFSDRAPARSADLTQAPLTAPGTPVQAPGKRTDKRLRLLIPAAGVMVVILILGLWLMTGKEETPLPTTQPNGGKVAQTPAESTLPTAESPPITEGVPPESMDKTAAVTQEQPDVPPAPEPAGPYQKLLQRAMALAGETDAYFLDIRVSKAAFHVGDTITYTFKSDKPCYMTLLNFTSEGQLVQIFPNRFSATQFVSSDKPYHVPDEQMDFDLEVTGPRGTDTLVAFASDAPFNLLDASFDQQPFYIVDKRDHYKITKIAQKIDQARLEGMVGKQLRYTIQ